MLEIKLIIERFEPFGNWYVLRREQHDGREWEEKIDHCNYYMRSDRLVPKSDVEGTNREWLCIAEALKTRTECGFTRVEVYPNKNKGMFIWSPKQSGVMEPVLISDESAKYLYDNILKTLDHIK